MTTLVSLGVFFGNTGPSLHDNKTTVDSVSEVETQSTGGIQTPYKVIAEDGVNMRSQPNEDSEIIITMTKDSVVYGEAEEDKSWIKTSYKNREVYINKEYLDAVKDPSVAKGRAPGPKEVHKEEIILEYGTDRDLKSLLSDSLSNNTGVSIPKINTMEVKDESYIIETDQENLEILLRVRDTQPPIIVSGPSRVEFTQGQPVDLNPNDIWEAIDEVDGKVDITIDWNNFSINQLGKYTIFISAYDNNGNMTSADIEAVVVEGKDSISKKHNSSDMGDANVALSSDLIKLDKYKGAQKVVISVNGKEVEVLMKDGKIIDR